MFTFNLLKQLQKHKPLNQPEKQHVKNTMELVAKNPNCFKRENLEGHITASGFLFNADFSKVLLTKHKKLQCWLQLGGHSDGDKNSFRVAKKETWEESGIANIKPIFKTIVDVDIQDIPFYEPKNVPAHKHYDIRFFLKTNNENFVMSDESDDLRWFTLNEYKELAKDKPDMERIVSKWETLLINNK